MLNTIEEAIEDIKSGKVIIVVDDEDRENEGDFLAAAEMVTPEMINFMATHGRGLICAPLIEDRCEELDLELMVGKNTAEYETPFTVSVDLIGHGCTTGISASDRSKTIQSLVNPNTRPAELGEPGHIFPLKAVHGGVLERAGHTEGTVDLARICGLKPAGVICEMLKEDGSMMRTQDLRAFADEHALKMTSVAEIMSYRQMHEKLIELEREIKMPTRFGEFRLRLYSSLTDQKDHLALVCGEPSEDKVPLIRVHSECLTGDIFHSMRCDCGAQLETAMQEIQAHGYGAVVYARQEGRGIGLAAKLHAYELQEQGLDTVEANKELGFGADLRDYGIAAQILRDLEMQTINLMTNNPAKVSGLEKYGVEIKDRVPLVLPATKHNDFYMSTKRDKMGHII